MKIHSTFQIILLKDAEFPGKEYLA